LENDELKQKILENILLKPFRYTTTDFEDLCRGPHLPNIKFIRNFKLTRVAGAYLGGDENAEMLIRTLRHRFC